MRMRKSGGCSTRWTGSACGTRRSSYSGAITVILAANPQSASAAEMKALLKQVHLPPIAGGKAQPGTKAKFSD